MFQKAANRAEPSAWPERNQTAHASQEKYKMKAKHVHHINRKNSPFPLLFRVHATIREKKGWTNWDSFLWCVCSVFHELLWRILTHLACFALSQKRPTRYLLLWIMFQSILMTASLLVQTRRSTRKALKEVIILFFFFFLPLKKNKAALFRECIHFKNLT